jgi:hypothetical protein
MTEPLRKEDTLTTADIAADRRTTGPALVNEIIDREQQISHEEVRGSVKPRTPLFTESESRDFGSQWDTIQTGFVDEPRQAVQGAPTRSLRML